MPPVNTFKQGAVGTGDRVADFHPESWSPTVHKALPYNKFPMMTIMDAMMKGSGSIDSRFHHWPEEAYVPYFGDVLDVYTDVLSTAYTSGGVEGTPLYVSVTSQEAAQIRSGDDILISNDSNDSLRVIRVNNVVVADDTSSYFTGTLAQTDTGNVLAQTDLHWGLMSDAQAEGSELPTATSHDPQWFENVTQIIMESVEITGSEEKEKERISGNKWSRDKMNAFTRLKMKEEWANMFGVYKVGTGSNGKRKSHMRGAITAVRENESGNIIDWRAASGYSGSWLNSGLNWLEEVVNDASVYAESDSRTFFCGNGAWKGINDAVRDSGYFRLETRQNAFGIKIKTLVGLTHDLNVILSPTLSTRGFNNSGFLCDMQNIRKKVFRPLRYVKQGQRDSQGGYVFVDGRKEGWYQETTQEIVNTRAMRWLSGIGLAHN